MKIGIDVDGVLTDIEKFQLFYGKKFFKNKYDMEVKNPTAYDIKQIFNCSDKQSKKFWSKYIWKYCIKQEMREYAKEEIDKLREDNDIYIITSRVYTTDNGIKGALFRGMLKFWLRKNRFKYDKIFFCSEKNTSKEKLNICLKEKVDILVDDNPDNLLLIKKEIPVICFSATWNEMYSQLECCRIKDFRELSTMIDKIMG